MSVPSVPPVGEIARRYTVPLHCVEYAIRTRGIQPIGRAGNPRVFAEPAIVRIASELRRIDEEKGGSNV